MDEKDQKSLTIGDILDQLAKPPKLQGPENLSPRSVIPTPQQIRPTDLNISSSPTPQQKPQIPTGGASSGINLPRIGKESEETGIREPQSGSIQPSEVRLYIRTMSTDLERLKRGQKPSDLEIKNIAAPPLPMIPPPFKAPSLPPIAPIRPLPKSSPSPMPFSAPPLPALPRPVIPSSRPPQTLPPSDTPLTPPITEEEHHHKERRISEAELLPQYLGALIPKKVAKTKKEKVEYGLIAKVIGSGMTVGIISTVVIALGSYLLLYFLVFNRKEVVISTPIPSSTALIPTPIINELETIFKAVSMVSFKISENKAATLSEFKAFIDAQILAKKGFKRINFTDSVNTVINPNFTELLDIFSLGYPPELKEAINNQGMTFIYGQAELFDESASGVIPKKVVFIVEIKDINKTLEIIKNWELTMPGTFKDIFNIDPTKEASSAFLDNERRGVKVRYKNFPLPDKSIDYSIVSSLTGRHYLLLTNSRESMYSPTDKLLGL